VSPRLNGEDFNAANKMLENNRLFSLFAQNRLHRNAQFVDHSGANNYCTSLKLDWNDFCSDLVSDPIHVTTWQRLSQQITKYHRSKFVPTSKPLLDSKFKRSFIVAMSLTVRALTIKGVSPDIIAMTQKSLCQQHSQQPKSDSKGRQKDSWVTEFVPSESGKPIPVLPFRPAGIPTVKRRSLQVGTHQLAKPAAASTSTLSSKHCRCDALAPLHTKSLPTFSKAKSRFNP